MGDGGDDGGGLGEGASESIAELLTQPVTHTLPSGPEPWSISERHVA